MKFTATSIILCAVAAMAVGLSIDAADTDSVDITVTARNISVAVTDGDVSYGTLDLDSTRDTTASQENETQTATNDGNVAEDFNIIGQDSVAWTLESAAGANQYTHRFSINAGSSWASIAESGYTTLTTNIASTGNDTFDLEVHTPTTSSTNDAQDIDVTVQAVLHT
jgi:hypothetical protein